jgi:hypothetical protein
MTTGEVRMWNLFTAIDESLRSLRKFFPGGNFTLVMLKSGAKSPHSKALCAKSWDSITGL